MAKLIFTAAALFLLFAFSHARAPSDLPNGRDDATDNKIPVTDAEPFKATTNTLRLPSERPGSESGPVVELEETETVPVAEEEKKLSEAEFATIESNEENTADASKSEAVPLTIISFRPVGRHFPRRPFPLSLRPGHRCGHGRRQPKRWTPRFHGSEREKNTPYGDDMILSSGDEMKFDRPFRGGARQIPARWFNFRHGGPRFPYKHDDDMESERPHRHHRRHHHHDHDLDQENEVEETHREHKHDHEHEHEHEHRGGLFRGFRKFLNRF